MAATPHNIAPVKDFDPRTAGMIIGGTNLEDLQEFGWTLSKSHDLNYTIDNNAIWVHVPPELTATGVVFETSPSVDALRSTWQNEDSIAVTGRPADDAGYSGTVFTNAKITDVDKSNYTIDGIPTVTFDIQGADMN